MINLLNAREQEIFNLLAENKTNQEIANVICLSPETVKKNLQGIYAKLGIESDEGRNVTRRKAMMVAQKNSRRYSAQEIRQAANEIFMADDMHIVNVLLNYLEQ